MTIQVTFTSGATREYKNVIALDVDDNWLKMSVVNIKIEDGIILEAEGYKFRIPYFDLQYIQVI